MCLMPYMELYSVFDAIYGTVQYSLCQYMELSIVFRKNIVKCNSSIIIIIY